MAIVFKGDFVCDPAGNCGEVVDINGDNGLLVIQKGDREGEYVEFNPNDIRDQVAVVENEPANEAIIKYRRIVPKPTNRVRGATILFYKIAEKPADEDIHGEMIHPLFNEAAKALAEHPENFTSTEAIHRLNMKLDNLQIYEPPSPPKK